MGERGFSHSPIFKILWPEPGKTSCRTTDAANLKAEKRRKTTANEARVDLLKNGSRLSTGLRRLQQLPLQEKPPSARPTHRHTVGALTSGATPNKLAVSSSVNSCSAIRRIRCCCPSSSSFTQVLHVMNEDHNVVEALDRVVRHVCHETSPVPAATARDPPSIDSRTYRRSSPSVYFR